MQEVFPQVREVSLQVQETSPQVREVSLQVRETSPQVREVSPQVRETSPQVREVSPQVQETSPQVGKLLSHKVFQLFYPFSLPFYSTGLSPGSGFLVIGSFSPVREIIVYFVFIKLFRFRKRI
jgi:hypothetical protein